MYGGEVMPARRAGSGVGIYSDTHCQEPKTGQQKVQLKSKTKHFAHLGMLFILGAHNYLETHGPKA